MTSAGSALSLLASRIEDAGLNASAPPEQRWLDGWLLRFSPGKAKRARCINAVADGRLLLGERLEHALELYREVVSGCRPFCASRRSRCRPTLKTR